jgi:vacuolar-type H+-ATPase subunit F/Vma7
MASPSPGRKAQAAALLAVIGDEDTVVGMLLAGVGDVDARRNSNFLVIDNSEPRICSASLARRVSAQAPHARATHIGSAFARPQRRRRARSRRLSIASPPAPTSVSCSSTNMCAAPPSLHSLLLGRSDPSVARQVATMIRPTIDAFEQKSPAILEIPSKEHPYDPSQDAIHRRTKLLLGIRE